jgi:hypothetical protein
MSSRDIIVVLHKMISFIPDEEKEDNFKYRLTKIMKSHLYKADEIKFNSWIETQECLDSKLADISPDEMPEWMSQLLKVWTNNVQ